MEALPTLQSGCTAWRCGPAGLPHPEVRRSLAYSQQLEARVAAAGAEEGIEFRFDQIKKTPNTFEAHRLIWFAGNEQSPSMTNTQNAVVENLFRAYFIDAEDVGDTEVLTRIGAESGLNMSRLEELFAVGLGTGKVISEESESRARGVTGVPAFFINGEPIASETRSLRRLPPLCRARQRTIPQAGLY